MENTRAQKSLILTIFKGVIKKTTRKINRRGDVGCTGNSQLSETAASFIKGTNTTCSRAFY